ncbi:MAG: bifunctional diguanylate cyclase/phosphodiesterase [Kineosporiaceae bacterium]
MAAASVVLVVVLPPAPVLPSAPSSPTAQLVIMAALVAAFIVAELTLLRIDFRSEVFSFSLAGLPLVLGALVLQPALLPLARIGGVAVVFLVQRLSPMKSFYNVCAYAFETALVSAGLHLWLHPDRAGHAPLEVRELLITFGVVAAADLVLSVSVLAVIALHQGLRAVSGGWRALVPSSSISGATTVVGLAVATLASEGLAGGLLLAALTPIGVILYRSYVGLQLRNRSLQLVHEFVADSQGHADDALELGRELLANAQTAFNARWTALLLVSSYAAPETYMLLDDAGVVRMSPEPMPAELTRLSAEITTDRVPRLLGRSRVGSATRRALREAGCRDAMVVPLAEEEYPQLTLIIADRLTESVGFTEDDLAVARTLAGHAATAMRGAMLLERLQFTATHDTLTGLANRALLELRLSELPRTQPEPAAVLLLDLNRFKEINDTLGHSTGDRVLRVVAERLRRTAPEGSLVARLGGDEFAILLPSTPHPDSALDLATSVAQSLRRPLTLDDIDVSADASIGLAYSGLDPADDPADLLRQADLAMYEAKTTGHGVVTYTRELERGHAERLALVTDLQLALDRGELSIAYQPVLDLHTRTIRRVEALSRWEHPRLGPLRPDIFVALAESTGLIHELTRYVLSSALAEVRRWADQGLDVQVSVNLSARNLADPQLPATVARLLERAGVSPQNLTLEITESSIIADPARAQPVLAALAAMGLTLSLDDFGTGYSSLSYLRTLPVQEVKIDKSFVFALADRADASARVLIESIIQLAHRLGLRVTAEGVEDADMLELLAEAGCDGAQGFHISKPASVPRATTLLRRHAGSADGKPFPGGATGQPLPSAAGQPMVPAQYRPAPAVMAADAEPSA